jgi:hypothetical protein
MDNEKLFDDIIDFFHKVQFDNIYYLTAKQLKGNTKCRKNFEGINKYMICLEMTNCL